MSSWSPRRSDLSASYIESFHRDHAGITERILRRARSADTDSYEWLVAAVHSRAFVLDIGSGSGPVAARVQYWIGIDRSPEELAVAKLAGRPTVVRATADALPARSAAVVVAVSAMSLQVLEPIDDVMAELARVMRPGGAARGSACSTNCGNRAASGPSSCATSKTTSRPVDGLVVMRVRPRERPHPRA